MKNDFVLPILVLSLICLVVAGALAVVNNFTLPVIELAAAERAAAARKEIIPEADGFDFLVVEGAPRSIIEIYKATNDTGYIFIISIPGYGGNIDLICGINNDGRIIKTAVLAHTETKGMTDPVFAQHHPTQPTFQGNFIGKDKDLNGIVPVTGATISSNAYKNGIKDAFTAFELIRK